MSKYLADILEADSKQFQSNIEKLEALTRNSGVDIKLSSELKSRASSILRDLRLDEDDSSADEVFHSLKSRLAVDDDLLNKKLKISEKRFQNEIIDYIEKKIKPGKVWAVNKPALRAILRANPPAKLAKQLKYRSVDSMIKKEDIATLVALLPYCQPKSWFNKFYSQLSKLKASDFENRSIQFIELPHKRWPGLSDIMIKLGHVRPVIVPVSGAIAYPEISFGRAASSLFLALTLHTVNDLMAISFYSKLIHMLPDFGELYSGLVRTGKTVDIKLGENVIDWTVLMDLYSANAEQFEPFIQTDDLQIIDVEHVYDKALNSSSSWSNWSVVCWVKDDALISANLTDVAINEYFKLGATSSTAVFAQKRIKSELMFGYLLHDPSRAMIDNQLDTILSPNQTISIS